MKRTLLMTAIAINMLSCAKDGSTGHGKNPIPTFTISIKNVTPSQFLPVGNSGIDSGSQVALTVISSLPATISDVTFQVHSMHTSDVRSISFDHKMVSVTNGIAKVSGLSLIVHQGTSTDLPSYYISYNGTQNGATSGDTVAVVPISVTCNGSTIPIADLQTPPLVVVNSRIDYVTVRPSKRNVVSPGVMDILNVEFHVNAMNDIAINTLPLTLTPNAMVKLSTVLNSVRVVDSASGSVIGTINSAFATNGGSTAITLLNGNNNFLKGTTNVLLLAVITDQIGTTGTNNLVASLQPASLFSWTDIAGGVTIPQTGIDMMGDTFRAPPITIQGRPALIH